MRTQQTVGVVGAGLIGRAWSIVFSRAGFNVSLWDPVEAAVPAQVNLKLVMITPAMYTAILEVAAATVEIDHGHIRVVEAAAVATHMQAFGVTHIQPV